jgi:hypothetical protein
VTDVDKAHRDKEGKSSGHQEPMDSETQDNNTTLAMTTQLTGISDHTNSDMNHDTTNVQVK